MSGATTGISDASEELVQKAIELGASDARVIDATKIVLDRRARLKCAIPRCPNYGMHQMCPPNIMHFDEFEAAVRSYRRALVVQLEAEYDSLDKSSESLTGPLCEDLDKRVDTRTDEVRLHTIVGKLEAMAFKHGLYYAAGLIGGECRLCDTCVPPSTGEPCKRPFEARPSMEAMGIDVVATCRNAGLPLGLSSPEKVRWTGLILLD